MGFTLNQFAQAFEARDAEGRPYVLIGGQAVNYWAETFLKQEPALRSWLPFTSEDIDFCGGRADVLRIAGELGATAQFPQRIQMTALAGIVPLSIDGFRTTIEVVRQVPGVPTGKIDVWAVTATRDGKIIRVLDPISLLCCKANLALTVAQKERRDVDHLHIMLHCVRAFLRETLAGVEGGELPARGWLGAVERVLKLAESAIGRKAARKFTLNWRTALPESEIGASCHRQVVQFHLQRLPQWHAKIAGYGIKA